MATFVLVHEAWHGGWCWQRVVPFLHDAGHNVFTPTLSGLGERADLAKPEIDLSTHVNDVVAVMEGENLNDAVLVGHGYGGMVISGVAERLPKRIDNLVFLDGVVPYGGDSVFDLMPTSMRRELQERARAEGDGWRVPWPPLERWGLVDAASAEFVGGKLVAQPLKTFEERLPTRNIAAIHLTRSYIYCTNPKAEPFGRFAERARAEAWRYREIETGHDAMVTEPRKFANVLLEVCRLAGIS